MPRVPERLLRPMSRQGVDFLAMSEDLPDPNSRVRLDGDRIVLDWHRTNMTAHRGLVAKLKGSLKAAGFPLVLSHLSTARRRRTNAARSGSATIPKRRRSIRSAAPSTIPTSSCWMRRRSVTSAAVNPSLTVAALALRAADHIRRTKLA